MKEDIKPKDGKRKLYFTIDMQSFILYNLNKKTTCEIILKENKEQIQRKIPNVNLDDYDFFLIDLKSIKKNQTNTTKVRVLPNMQIYDLLQNQKTILCFLQKNQAKNEANMKTNNNKKIDLDEKERKKVDKIKEMKKNYLNNKICDIIYTDKIFLYDYNNNIFNKLKASLSEKQLTIHGKSEITIYIQDIKTIKYCDSNDSMLSVLLVNSGSKPPFFMIITTNDTQHIIGCKAKDRQMAWKSKLDILMSNYKNFTTDIDFSENIKDLKRYITSYENNIIINDKRSNELDDLNKLNELFELNDDLNNYFNDIENKKKFYSLFEDKKIPEIIENIYIYRNCINKKEYGNALNYLYNILCMINSQKDTNKKSTINEIINKEKFNVLCKIYNDVNNTKNKNLLNINLFDEILSDFKNKGKNLRSDVQKLPTCYFMKLLDMNYNNSFLEIS